MSTSTSDRLGTTARPPRAFSRRVAAAGLPAGPASPAPVTGDDPTRGASVLFYDTREHANAAHEAALEIMRERQPSVAIQVAASETTSVLAMA